MRWRNISLYSQIVVICLVFMLVKGSSTSDSILGFEKCGLASQLTVLVLLLISYFYAKYIFKQQYTADMKKE